MSVVVQRANYVLGLARRAFAFNDLQVFLLVYKTLARPHLEYAVQAWSPWKLRDIRKVESVQRRATKFVAGCRHLSYEDRLSALGLPTLHARRTRGDMILTFRIIKGLIHLNAESFFVFARDSRTRGHDHKLAVLRSSCDARRFFFSRRVVPVWNSLPGDVVNSDCVVSFKRRYDRHVANLLRVASDDIWIH